MTDRELLEAAAKAAGHDLEWYGQNCVIAGDIDVWNPLTDDGDALRLAVKLEIDMAFRLHSTRTFPTLQTQDMLREEHYNDPYAATRRAIVRAAAAIGVK